MNRILTLAIIVLLAASNLVLVGFVSAQSVTKPSVPNFTIQYVDYSYDVPSTTTTTTDPFTGRQTTQTKDGYHVDKRTIELHIVNQAIPASEAAYDLSLFYNLKFKGHFEEDWRNLPDTTKYGYYNASESTESTISLLLTDLESTYYIHLSNDSQLDFQVQALIGYEVDMDTRIDFHGERSDWTNAQTVRINESSTSPAPTVPEYPFMAILPLLGVSLVIVVGLVRKKKVPT